MEQRRNHQFDPFGPDVAAYDDAGLGDLEGVEFNDPASFFTVLGGGAGTNSPIPDFMSLEDVRRVAKERTTNIFASHKTLHEMLLRHEATIHKRWTKRNRQQRLKVLLEAWPDMPATHRPDFQAFRKETPAQRELGTAYRPCFIWPYINREDLLKPNTLLLLLNSRGRNDPWEFAAADNEAMSLGKVTKALVPIFLNGHVMIMNGVTGPSDYGKLVSWESHPDAFDWVATRKQPLPGEGILILEAQQRVLEFLVQCCQNLLHDIPDLTGESAPLKPPPQLKSDQEITGFESLVVMTEEAPYRLPAKLDLGKIESLLAARASAAEDRLWSLREDPGYFAEQVVEAKEHRLEMLKDSMGDTHPTVKKSGEHILWQRVIASALTTAHFELEVFSELHRQSQVLRALETKHRLAISPSSDLPKEYLGALLQFRHLLDQAAKGAMNMLKGTLMASPPMRSFFVRDPPMDLSSTTMVARLKAGVKMDRVEERLIWLFQTLWEDGQTLLLAGLPLIVDELERLVRAEPKANAMLDSTIAGIIGDLSIISQCRAQLDLYQPWANSFDHFFYTDWKDKLEEEFLERTRPWGQMLATFRNLRGASKLAEPSQGRFAYPVEKRRTKESVAALRNAEANLDAFWTKIDELMRSGVRDLKGTATERLLSQPRVFQRTHEWIEPAVTKSRNKKQSNPDIDALSQSISDLGFHCASGEEPSPRPLPPKSKVKTKGTPAATTKEPAPAGGAEADSHPSFTVDARALKVFRMLFFNPDLTSSPGEIPWKDFLHAMAATGFMAQKLYGSVWQFRPTALEVERPILFHEPHPHAKIPFIVARRIGRRLNRSYGWFGGMFALKE